VKEREHGEAIIAEFLKEKPARTDAGRFNNMRLLKKDFEDLEGLSTA
jgi:lambda repressor-like predicted transcriptional regulator